MTDERLVKVRYKIENGKTARDGRRNKNPTILFMIIKLTD